MLLAAMQAVMESPCLAARASIATGTASGFVMSGNAQVGQFNRMLQQTRDLSTVGLATLSGQSPRTAGLERLAHSISWFEDPGDQIAAIEAILAEAEALWPDQIAHIIGTIIQDMVISGRITLRHGAHAAIGAALQRAAAELMPDLLSDRVVSDNVSHDMLRCMLLLLSQRREFQPVNHAPDDILPQHRANRLKHEIDACLHRQIGPADLAPLLDELATLPSSLRARLLAMLMNVSWNTMRDPDNAPLLARASDMIDALPPQQRITPLEAAHNQIEILPHEIAAPLHGRILHAVNALPEHDDARYARSREDLSRALRRQGETLACGGLRPGETLAGHQARIRQPAAISAVASAAAPD